MKKFLAALLTFILVCSFCAVAYADNDDTNIQVIEDVSDVDVTDSDIVEDETTDDTSESTTDNLGEVITDPTEPTVWDKIFKKIFGSISITDTIENFKDFIEVISSFDLETLFRFDSGSVAVISTYLAKALDAVFKVFQFIFGSETSGLDAIYNWLGNIISGFFAK